MGEEELTEKWHLKGRFAIRRLIRNLFVFILSTGLFTNAFAAEIKLKDGRAVNGKIVEQTKDSLRVDTGIGVTLTYYLDQVDSIDGRSLRVEEKEAAAAPQQPAKENVESPQPNLPKSFIWEIRSATTTSYIVGSIHVADESFYPLPVSMEKGFQRADVLVVETDMSQIDPKLEEELKNKAMYKEGRTLKDDISPETFNMLKSFLDPLEIDVTPFLIMRPWMVSITLGQIAVGAMGLDPLFGIDAHFLRLAGSRKKQIQPLEDIREQVDLMSGFMDQDMILRQTLKEIMQEKDQVGDMISIWKKGDSKSMEKIVFDTPGMDDSVAQEYMEKLLYKRNEAMIKKIDGYLQTDKVYFIVVGAAHLLGDRGILHALKEKGYRLRQL